MRDFYLDERIQSVTRVKRMHTASASAAGMFCPGVEVADTFWARFVGLLGRKEMPSETGLWLRPSSGVHTFWMRFAIDVVALDAEMKIVGLYRSLRPWRMAANGVGTHSVLELPAGQIDASRLALGETVVVAIREEHAPDRRAR